MVTVIDKSFGIHLVVLSMNQMVENGHEEFFSQKYKEKPRRTKEKMRSWEKVRSHRLETVTVNQWRQYQAAKVQMLGSDSCLVNKGRKASGAWGGRHSHRMWVNHSKHAE